MGMVFKYKNFNFLIFCSAFLVKSRITLSNETFLVECLKKLQRGLKSFMMYQNKF